MKNLPFLLILPALLLAQAWDGTASTDWYTSDPAADAYTITTAEQLAGLAELVNNGNSFEGIAIKLGNSIALNDTTGWAEWDEETTGLREWAAIGMGGTILTFRGTFDGDGHVVSGVYINKPDADGQGLFGAVQNGTIQNGTIQNIGVVGSFVKGMGSAGGLVGYCYSDSFIISNSYATGNVSGSGVNNGTGGLVGSGGCAISNSYATGNVEGTSAARRLGGEKLGHNH
ncbi:MAG: hypothetical protein LBC85_02625 [Fibromonadaceae bacterium]|jgi:hypothetical protein|nr:hypothetical protein [Fibromonadaceae bacterium]